MTPRPAAIDTEFLLTLTTRLLAAPLSVTERARTLVELLVPTMATFAAVYIDDDGAPLVCRPEDARERAGARAALRSARRIHGVVLAVGDDTALAAVPLDGRAGTFGTLLVAAPEGTDGESLTSPLSKVAQLAGYALEKALLYDDAERAKRARDDILSVVVHDLRNPLTTARLAAARLTRAKPEEREPALAVVLRGIDRALMLVDDLLDATAVEAGRFSLQTAPCEVRSLVDDAARLFEPLATAAGVTLTTSAEQHVVRCDAHRLMQVLSNLIGNALKFTPRGGHISVHAAREGEVIVFSIADTGRGIPAKLLPRVFERFMQVRSGELRGAGLGLSIVKTIVEQHGGAISVSSELDRGTTFRFTIPLR
jgi:signal transduction histidine kinase